MVCGNQFEYNSIVQAWSLLVLLLFMMAMMMMVIISTTILLLLLLLVVVVVVVVVVVSLLATNIVIAMIFDVSGGHSASAWSVDSEPDNRRQRTTVSRSDQQHAAQELQLQRDPQSTSCTWHHLCTGLKLDSFWPQTCETFPAV